MRAALIFAGSLALAACSEPRYADVEACSYLASSLSGFDIESERATTLRRGDGAEIKVFFESRKRPGQRIVCTFDAGQDQLALTSYYGPNGSSRHRPAIRAAAEAAFLNWRSGQKTGL